MVTHHLIWYEPEMIKILFGGLPQLQVLECTLNRRTSKFMIIKKRIYTLFAYMKRNYEKIGTRESCRNLWQKSDSLTMVSFDCNCRNPQGFALSCKVKLSLFTPHRDWKLKLLLLVYKALNGFAPSYITNLLTYFTSAGSIRSSSATPLLNVQVATRKALTEH